MQSLLKVPNFDGQKIKNAVILYLVKNKRGNAKVLTVTENRKKIGLPGGRIERGETVFACMKREFGEETGIELPRLSMDKLHRFVYNGHTAIYVYFSHEGEHSFPGNSWNPRSKEILSVQFIDLEHFKGMIFDPTSPIRECARKSMREFIEGGYL